MIYKNLPVLRAQHVSCVSLPTGCMGSLFLPHVGKGKHTGGPTVSGYRPSQCDGGSIIKKTQDWIHCAAV